MSIKDKLANAKEVDIFPEIPPEKKRRIRLIADICIASMENGKKPRPYWLCELFLRILGC